MGFYGNITNTSKIQFVFDKTYQNRKSMEENMATDNVYIGRYVLVDYDERFPGKDYARLYMKKDAKGEHFYFSPDFAETTKAQIVNKSYYDDNGNVVPEKQGEDKASQSWQYYQIYDKEPIYIWVEETQNGKNVSYEKFYYADYKTDSFILLDSVTGGTITTKDNYFYNYQIDQAAYGDIGRGWDSTVWQKVYSDNEEKYVMIAELNSVVPTFGITVDAPSANPVIPHFDADSSSMYYNLHISPSWGFRVAEVGENELSDAKVTQISQRWNSDLKKVEADNRTYQGAIYFNKDGFNSSVRTQREQNTKDDGISVAPTGKSGTSYLNAYSHTSSSAVKYPQPDIQELSIYLPSIGDAISKMWDIVYGEGSEIEGTKNQFKRNQNISWNSLAGERLVTVKDDGSGFEYNDDKINTLAGCINSVHDLMGMIVSEEKKKPGESDESYTNRLKAEYALANRIYYGAYDASRPDYKGYFIKNLTYKFTPSETGYVELVNGNGLLKDFSTEDYYYYTNNNYYLEKNDYSEGNKYYLLNNKIFQRAIAKVDYEPDKFYYLDGEGNYKIETSASPYDNRAYYDIKPGFKVEVDSAKNIYFWPEEEEYLIKLKAYLISKSSVQQEQWSESGDPEGYYHGNGLFYLDKDSETNIEVYRPLTFKKLTNVYNKTKLYWFEDFLIKPAVDVNDEDVSIYAFENAIKTELSMIAFENNKFYYQEDTLNDNGEVISSDYYLLDIQSNVNFDKLYKTFQEDTITQITGENMLYQFDEDSDPVKTTVYFYSPSKFYYKEGDDYILAVENSRIDRKYFIIGTPTDVNDAFYIPNKYYYNQDGEYVLDKSEHMTEGRLYYNIYDLYVIDGNGKFDNYSKWNTNITEVPENVQLGIRTEVYEWKELTGFARTFNTIHGLILNINNLIKFNDPITRDLNTVQGCINQLNDIISKFDNLVPNQLVRVNNLGKIESVAAKGDNWINVKTNGEQVTFNHIGPVSATINKEDNVTPSFGSTFDITDHYFDNKGHKFQTETHTVKIPKGSYSDTSKVNGKKIITNIGFTDTTGAISSNSADLGEVLIADNETLNSRLNTLQNNINSEEQARIVAITAEEQARVKADNDEAIARKAADDNETSARQQAILAEQTAREQADANEASARQQAVETEANIRANAISAEAEERKTEDSKLSNRIDSLSNTTSGSVEGLTNRLETLENYNLDSRISVLENKTDAWDNAESNAVTAANAYTDEKFSSDEIIKTTTEFSYNVGEEEISTPVTIQDLFNYIAQLEQRIKILEESSSGSEEENPTE